MHFEGDSIMAMAAMQKKEEDFSPIGPIINDIGDCLQGLANSQFSHAQKEANHVAHRLARAGIGSQQKVIWSEEPLDLVVDERFK